VRTAEGEGIDVQQRAAFGTALVTGHFVLQPAVSATVSESDHQRPRKGAIMPTADRTSYGAPERAVAGRPDPGSVAGHGGVKETRNADG
jgi:hypothetical protein